jgi:DNA transposition AAA+ family ATPase
MITEAAKAHDGVFDPLSNGRSPRMAAIGELTDKEREQILRELEEVQAAENISTLEMAKILGIERTTLSRVKSGTYTGNVDNYLRIARSWLDGRRERFGIPEAPFAPTKIACKIMAVCQAAIDLPAIGVVRTRSGAGKTSAALEMVRRVGPASGIYLQAGQACRGEQALLVEIARKLGIKLSDYCSISKSYRVVRRELAERYSAGKGGSMLIFIDEATTLRPAAINMLRNLHDDPTCRPAIVLADTLSRMNYFINDDDHRRTVNQIVGGNEQLRSRAQAQYIMNDADAISAEDVKLVVDATLEAFGRKRQLPAASYKYLHELANLPGSLRNVTARLENVWYFAQRGGFEADWSVSQLDYLARLSGRSCKMEWKSGTPSPFQKKTDAA